MDDTKTRLLRTAGPVFAEKGYQTATVREICQKAGVNVASVNYYFGDKERLYIEAVKEASRMRAEQVPMPNWSETTQPTEMLTGFIQTLLHRMIGEGRVPWQAELMLREILHPTEACGELAEEYFRPQIETLLSIIRMIVPRGTAAHTIRQMAYSIIGQCLLYRVAGEVVAMLTPQDELKAHFSTEQLSAHIARFSLAALGSPPTKQWVGDDSDSEVVSFDPGTDS